MIALAVQNGMQMHQMDVTTAFLTGELQEEVYMKVFLLRARRTWSVS